jgi:NADH dehydrogenase
MDTKTSIVVLGAGYAGLLATVRLARKQRDAEIVLVNPVDTFVERLRLHQYAANQEIKRRPIATTLRGTGVKLVVGRAAGIDRPARTVTVEDADGAVSTLAYDYLLYAMGSFTERSSVAGLAEHVYTLEARGPMSVEALRSSLPELAARAAALAVVGGGATGIEAAAEFAECYPALQVSLITGGALAAPLGDAVASKIRRRLRRLGVTVLEHTAVTGVAPDHLSTASGAVMPIDACLWAGGFAVPRVARRWSTLSCARSVTRASTRQATQPSRSAGLALRCAWLRQRRS